MKKLLLISLLTASSLFGSNNQLQKTESFFSSLLDSNKEVKEKGGFISNTVSYVRENPLKTIGFFAGALGVGLMTKEYLEMKERREQLEKEKKLEETNKYLEIKKKLGKLETEKELKELEKTRDLLMNYMSKNTKICMDLIANSEKLGSSNSSKTLGK